MVDGCQMGSVTSCWQVSCYELRWAEMSVIEQTGCWMRYWPWRRNCKLTDYSQQVVGAPNLCSLPQVLLAHAYHVPNQTIQHPSSCLVLPTHDHVLHWQAQCCSKVLVMQSCPCTEAKQPVCCVLPILQNTFGPDASFLYGQCVFTTPDPASLALTQVLSDSASCSVQSAVSDHLSSMVCGHCLQPWRSCVHLRMLGRTSMSHKSKA